MTDYNGQRPYTAAEVTAQEELEELMSSPNEGESEMSIPQGGEEGGVSDIPLDNENQRGIPVDPSVAFAPQSIRTTGSARINALIDMFGEDAFILQHVVFKIPPLSIKIRKQNLNYKWKSLRTKDVTVVPSGSGECYIDIPLVFVGERQLKTNLADLLIVFKIAPFAFIENKFIRENLIPNSPEDSMAVCLESLHLSTRTGRPDVVSADLSMKWFNYKPYSHHFWFRKDFRQLSGMVDDEGNNGQGNVSSSSADAPAINSIIDMSQMENLDQLDFSSPPEVRLPTINEDSDPTDPFIAPTQPVVYPFNSAAFLSYVEHFKTTNHGFTFRTWNDQMRMKWNSYRRVPWPQNIINVETEGGTVQSPPNDNQPSRRERQPNPPAVTGRDIVLFVGDSISVGYLGIPDQDSIGLRDVSSSIRSDFRQHSGFEFYAIAKVGANSNTLKSVTREALNNNTFSDRVAGVVIACGANDLPDGLTSPTNTVDNISDIVDKAVGHGAIAVILPVWPIQDPISGDQDFGKKIGMSCTEWGDASQATVSQRNNQLSALADRKGPNAIFRNTHVSEITTDPESWNGTWVSSFRQYQCSNTIINVHPKASGYRVIAGVVNRLLPWDSFSGSEPTREDSEVQLYTVLEVLDGDTIRVRGVEGIITVRFNYIDAPEIGQAPWGEESKDYLTSIIGEEVRLENTSQDNYGRTVAEVIDNSSGFNLNKKMISAGYAVVYTQFANTTAQAEYYSLETTARTNNLQVWSSYGLWQTPWEWRRLNDRPEI